MFGGRPSWRPQAQQRWQKNLSLFGPRAGARMAPRCPRGRLRGTKVGAGGREGGVPRGGAQRREGPPPLPALPLRSAPRPPTVPVPVAVPPAPAAPCPERAGPAAPWPGRSGTGSSARSSSGTSATSECRTSKVNKHPRDPSHAAPLLFLLFSVFPPAFPRARGSVAHPTAAGCGKAEGAGGFPRRGCGARRGEGEQTFPGALRPPRGPGGARRGAAEPGPAAPEGPSRSRLRAPTALAAEQAVLGSPCLAANGSFGFRGWEESRGQSGGAAGAAQTLLAPGPRSRRGRWGCPGVQLSKRGQNSGINHLRDTLLFCHRLCWRKGCKYLGLDAVGISPSKVIFALHQQSLCD